MPKNENTVTLPALPAGREYVSIAIDLVANMGHGVGPMQFRFGGFTDAVRDGLAEFAYRQCSGDGGAKGADASEAVKAQGIRDKAARIKDGTFVFGAGGGGARLSTYEKTMRSYMVDLARRLVRENKSKKGLAKTWIDDHGGQDNPGKVFRAIVDLVCATTPDADADEVFAARWPDHESKVRGIADALDAVTAKAKADVGEPDPMNLAA